MSIQNGWPPADVVNALHSGECVLVAGSGLSAQSGAPTWSETLRRLLSFGVEQGLVPLDVLAELELAWRKRQYHLVADELSDRLPNRVLREQVAAFGSNLVPSGVHRLLSQLPFS